MSGRARTTIGVETRIVTRPGRRARDPRQAGLFDSGAHRRFVRARELLRFSVELLDRNLDVEQSRLDLQCIARQRKSRVAGRSAGCASRRIERSVVTWTEEA